MSTLEGTLTLLHSALSMQTELFIYYRVEQGCCDELKAVVLAFQQHLCAKHPGLVARLFQRVDTANSPIQSTTWMETYSSTGRISLPLQRLIERAEPVPPKLMSGPRHMEVFAAIA